MLKKATPKNKSVESSEVVSDVGCIVKANAAATAVHKRKRKTGNRPPSGIVEPRLISDELAVFLGKGKGTQMARTEVTHYINAYISTNQLQDKTNGRRINADCKLSSLLKLKKDEELNYFNLQRYMSPHFAKSPIIEDDEPEEIFVGKKSYVYM